jgi:hypothetical protein
VPGVISIHEYVLKPDITPEQFETSFQRAAAKGLFDLPGLVDYYFVKGLRGVRQDAYAAIWVYESLQAWERLWGTVDAPRCKEEYPEKWKVWEDKILKPLLVQDPDKIHYTAYQILETKRHE